METGPNHVENNQFLSMEEDQMKCLYFQEYLNMQTEEPHKIHGNPLSRW